MSYKVTIKQINKNKINKKLILLLIEKNIKLLKRDRIGSIEWFENDDQKYLIFELLCKNSPVDI